MGNILKNITLLLPHHSPSLVPHWITRAVLAHLVLSRLSYFLSKFSSYGHSIEELGLVARTNRGYNSCCRFHVLSQAIYQSQGPVSTNIFW